MSIAAEPPCVLRQARDEEHREWHRQNATKKEPHPELVEGRSMVMQPTSIQRTSRHRPTRAEFEALDLAGGGLGQLVDELDPARIFVRGKPRFHMLLQR